MYWLDNDSGVTTPPAIPAVVSSTRQYFTEGGGGDQPSIPGGEWFNMMTDELLAVLAEAGISPDKANHAQLRDAIKKVVANAAATQSEVNESNPANQVDKYITVKTLWGWVKQATESVRGMMKVATQTQTNAGAADDVAVTPKKLRAGFAISLAANGYIAFPTWMGGLIIQWGLVSLVYSGLQEYTGTVTMPITFPSAMRSIVGTSNDAVNTAKIVMALTGPSSSAWKARFEANMSGGGNSFTWIAIGH